MTVSTQIGAMIALLTKDPTNGGSINAIGHATQAIAHNEAKKTGTKMRDLLLTARRYHLGSDVTQMAALYGFNVDAPIENMLNIARPPFESVWIEWPVDVQLRAVGVEPTPDCPQFTGALVRRIQGQQTRFMITHVHHSPEKDMVDMAPLSIIVDTEHPLDKSEFKFSHEVIRDSLQGRVRYMSNNEVDPQAMLEGILDEEKLPSNLNLEKLLNSTLIGGSTTPDNKLSNLTQLFPYATYCLTPGFSENLVREMYKPQSSAKWVNMLKDIVAEHIAEHSGSMRFVLGALAVLNNKEYIKREPVKPGKRRPGELITPKLQPSYEFVTMTAPHIVYIKQIQGQQNSEHRRQHQRHEVSGTWVNYHKTGKADCNHEFANLDLDGNRKICLLCGRKKSWRIEHERGNIELGYKKRAARVVVE